jgi:hypothetical protein
MKYINVFCVCACAVTVSFAATPPRPIPCDISGLRYDPIQMKSEAYPIFLQTTSGNDLIDVTYKGNGTQEFHLVFIRKTAKDAIAAIDKFFEWEQLATSRGETLSKKISSVGSVSGCNVYTGFTSLSKDKHALQMGVRSKLLGDSSGAAAGIVDLLIDHPNAEKLKQMLIRLMNGESLDKAADVYR